MVQKVHEVPGAYEALTAEAVRRARATGVPDEIMKGFFNSKGHFPMSTDELNAWGNDPTNNPYGIQRRDPATGRWTAIMPGMLTPGKTDQDRGGFRQGDQTGHQILNAEDSDIQRFQDFHPEILDAPMAGPTAGGMGAGTFSSQSVRMDNANYVAPLADGRTGFVSVVGGVPKEYLDQASAEQDFNARGGGTAGAPPPASAPGGGAGGGSPGAGGAAPGGVGLNEPAAQAANAAVLAWLAKRRLDELELPEFRLKSETELAAMRRADALAVWKQEYERASLTGTLGGTPTLEGTKTAADITGYQAGAGTGKGQAVLDAIAQLRTDPGYLALDGSGRRAREAAVLQQVNPQLTAEQAAAAIDRMRTMTAASGGRMSALQTVEAVLNEVAPGAPTFEREQEQNRNLVSVLGLLANLRGPENAFAYANTLANVPASMRANINAAIGRLPVTAQNPAARGVLGDLGAPAPLPAVPPAAAPGVQLPPNVGGLQAGDVQPAASSGYAPSAAVGTPTGPPVAFDPRTIRPTAPANAGQPGMLTYGAAGTPATEMYHYPAGTAPSYPTSGAPPLQTLATGETPQPMRPGVVQRDYGQGVPEVYRRTAPTATGQPVMTQGQPAVLYRGQQVPPAYGPLRAAPTTAGGMQLPSQWSPSDMNKLDPYARSLMVAGYENAGEDKTSLEWRYRKSLPVATGPRTGRLGRR